MPSDASVLGPVLAEGEEKDLAVPSNPAWVGVFAGPAGAEDSAMAPVWDPPQPPPGSSIPVLPMPNLVQVVPAAAAADSGLLSKQPSSSPAGVVSPIVRKQKNDAEQLAASQQEEVEDRMQRVLDDRGISMSNQAAMLVKEELVPTLAPPASEEEARLNALETASKPKHKDLWAKRRGGGRRSSYVASSFSYEPARFPKLFDSYKKRLNQTKRAFQTMADHEIKQREEKDNQLRQVELAREHRRPAAVQSMVASFKKRETARAFGRKLEKAGEAYQRLLAEEEMRQAVDQKKQARREKAPWQTLAGSPPADPGAGPTWWEKQPASGASPAASKASQTEAALPADPGPTWWDPAQAPAPAASGGGVEPKKDLLAIYQAKLRARGGGPVDEDRVLRVMPQALPTSADDDGQASGMFAAYRKSLERRASDAAKRASLTATAGDSRKLWAAPSFAVAPPSSSDGLRAGGILAAYRQSLRRRASLATKAAVSPTANGRSQVWAPNAA